MKPNVITTRSVVLWLGIVLTAGSVWLLASVATSAGSAETPKPSGLIDEVDQLKKALADVQQELQKTKVELAATSKSLSDRITADVTKLNNRTTAIERTFGSSDDHAVIVAGHNNAGGQSYVLLLTPYGSLVLRHNNPADPKGWDKQAEVFRLR
jgi:hypothetical protein